MDKHGPLKAHDDRHSPGPIERTVMAVSALLTLTLLAYVGWHAWTAPPDANPSARVVSVETLDAGQVAVSVEILNDSGVGLLSAVVEVDCDEPAPSVEFANIPAGGRRKGHVVCPEGTVAPTASVASWVEA